MYRGLVASTVALLAAGCAAPPVTAPAPSAPSSPAPPAAPAPASPAAEPDHGWAAVETIVVAAPPWDHAVVDAGAGRRAVVVPRLTRLLVAPNEITDEGAWLARNGFERPGAAPTDVVPEFYRGEPRLRAIEQPGWTLAVYGPPSAGRYLLAAGAGGRRLAFDFASFLHAPGARPGEATAWTQDLLWAATAGARLYVSSAHLTYAATTGGMNGYVTALDLETGAILWRSRPRVANARTFEVIDDALVTGYGFTAEPDALFVVDRFTGEVLEETPVRTAPTWIIRRAERLFVRAYDADYVYALR